MTRTRLSIHQVLKIQRSPQSLHPDPGTGRSFQAATGPTPPHRKPSSKAGQASPYSGSFIDHQRSHHGGFSQGGAGAGWCGSRTVASPVTDGSAPTQEAPCHHRHSPSRSRPHPPRQNARFP
ncbi:uncharacterized protein V6R79_007773 [Siganus canaliculatus]